MQTNKLLALGFQEINRHLRDGLKLNDEIFLMSVKPSEIFVLLSYVRNITDTTVSMVTN